MLEVVSTLVIIFKAVIVISWLRLLILSASPFMVWQILPLITGMIDLMVTCVIWTVLPCTLEIMPYLNICEEYLCFLI